MIYYGTSCSPSPAAAEQLKGFQLVLAWILYHKVDKFCLSLGRKSDTQIYINAPVLLLGVYWAGGPWILAQELWRDSNDAQVRSSASTSSYDTIYTCKGKYLALYTSYSPTPRRGRGE
jgi:hypothetical protein